MGRDTDILLSSHALGVGLRRALLVAWLVLAMVVCLALGTQVALAADLGNVIDSGFESGAEGATLASPPWAVVGSPQHREYDDARARNGARSAWIQGPTVAAYAGVTEASSASMTADGSEVRFWVYQENTNQLRRFYDNVTAGATNGPYLVLLNSDGTIQVNIAKAAPAAGYITGYTTVGTQSTGWTQYRIVHDFTAQTYTLSTRTASYGPWTQLKATGATGYDIPMRGSGTVTKTGGVALSANQNVQMWVDDVAFSATGIVDDPLTDTTPPAAPATLSAIDTPSDSGSSIGLSWAGATDDVGVTGYRLRRGTAPGVYGAPTAIGNVTSFTDATAVTGTRYYYSVSAIDAAGNEGARSPEANATAADNTIVTPGIDMPVSPIVCDTCHQGEHDHPCANCHALGDGHTGTPSSIHTPAVGTSCTSCHDSSLTIEHNGRKTAAGTDITCATCHSSTDPLVSAAIAAKNSTCPACHGALPHGDTDASHSNTADCAGAGCHGGTNLIATHAAIDCDSCHSSTRSEVVAAISSHDKSCTGCHGSAEPHGDLLSAHASTVTTGAIPALWNHDALWYWPVGSPMATDTALFSIKTQSCTNCHPSTNLLRVHGPAWDCAKCHDAGGPRSSFTDWNGTCQQGGCHALEPHNIIQAQSAHFAKRSQLGCGGSCHSEPDWGTRCDTTCHTVGGPAVGDTVDISPPITRASQVSSAPLTWQLYSQDFQTGVASTYYSLDGADFRVCGTSEALYGVVADGRVGSHTLRYYSSDTSGNIEAVQTITGVVDGPDVTPPSVTLQGIRLGAGSVVATSATLLVTDEGAYKSGASTLNVSYKAYKLGWGWTLGYFWKPFTYSVPLSDWDKASSVNRLEDTARAANSAQWVTVGSDGNRFIVAYNAVDRAGNASPQITDSVVIDNAAPVTTPATVTVGVFKWKLNVSDSVPLATYYSFDGAPFSVYTSADASAGIVNTQPDGSTQGAHNLRYYSEDALGHIENIKTHTYSVIETTPPMASLSATMTSSSVVISAWDPEGPLLRSGVKSIVGTVYQGVVSKSITTTFAAGDPAAVRSVEVTVPSDGSWTLQYYVYDWDGNQQWYYQSFRKDTTPPSSSLGGGWNTQWQLSASDGFGIGVAALHYGFDGAPYTQVTNPTGFVYFTTPAQLMTKYGTHTLSYYSVDKFGFTETPKSTSFVVPDTTKPTISLVKSGGTWSKSAYLTAQDAGAVTSGVKEIRYRLNDGTWVVAPFDTSSNPTATVQADIASLPNGVVKVDYYVVDIAGNASTTVTTYIQIDNAAPTVSVTHQSTNADGSIVVRIAATESGTGSGVDRCWYEYTDGTGYHGTGVISGLEVRTITLPAPASGSADASVSAYARDWMGNEGEPVVLTVPVIAPLDLLAPVTAANVAEGTRFSSTDGVLVFGVYPSDNKSGVATTYYKIDDGEWQTAAYSPELLVTVTGFGPHTFTFYSVDNAGNVEEAQVLSFEIVELATLSFDMTNVVYPNADWKSFDYAYDVELYDANDGLEEAWSGRTWDNGLPADTVIKLPAYDAPQPWRIVLTLHTLGGSSLQYTWYDVVAEAGQTVDLSGTYSESWVGVEQETPTTTSDAVPFYSVSGGQATTISLMASDEGGSGVATTYYELDSAGQVEGTDVSVPAPAAESEEHTLRFWSVDNAGNVETAQTVTFTIEASTP